MSTLPLPDLIALATRIADAGGCLADVDRATGKCQSNARGRLRNAGCYDLAARLAANGRRSVAAGAGRRAFMERAAQRRAERWEEIRHFKAAGYSPEHVAAIVGATPAALSRQAYRAGDKTMGHWFDQAVNRARAAA